MTTLELIEIYWSKLVKARIAAANTMDAAQAVRAAHYGNLLIALGEY